MKLAELLLHPLRLRIVQAFLGDRTLTTADLRAELPEAAAATLYRQVALLADAGVLEVCAQRRVRGTVERTYRLRTGAASLEAADLAGMSVEEHRQGFLAFTASLLADYDRYLAGADPDPGRDLVGYRQAALHLSDEELGDLAAELREVVLRRLALAPAPGRRRRLLSTVLMPADVPADVPGGGTDAQDEDAPPPEPPGA
ncbi:helix-turn-helix protein [Kineococcus xinjiangensis]|uniref:Helix-turn-helix protein n=1 Tax=Kineococcus xinjiangensis TaxID=512762 RepID=A0A2S6IJ86_9ACTN|nr:helix-turn-helix domain-containing protein [Kineococcus xinjiangensis]PPK94245.1 helix-turn-helix protein [Kineococcus xinjiangensis]